MSIVRTFTPKKLYIELAAVDAKQSPVTPPTQYGALWSQHESTFVLVLAEDPANRGKSVTNAMEYVVHDFCKRNGATVKSLTVF